MQNFHAPGLFELCKEIGRIKEAFSSPESAALEVAEKPRTNSANVLDGHAETLAKLSLPLSSAQATKTAARLRKPPILAGEFTRLLDDLYERISDECALIQVLVLNPTERARYAPSTPLFGGDFEAKFQTQGAFELDEAAKCLALARPTASVFHLMRLLEVGIGAMSRCLGIPDPIKPAERNWGAILKAVQDRINAKWPTSAARMSGDGQLFEALYASLDAVKNPWRNATMHVENKYTDDEAEHILIAVKGFMKKLAARMDENGDPKA